MLDTTLLIEFVSDLRQVGGFSAGTPISSTNTTDRHDINEILLEVALNTISLTPCKTLHCSLFRNVSILRIV
jgi:hypothetical protein